MITYICRNKDIKTGEDLPCTNTVCKTTFDVMMGGRWRPTRIEMAENWYLVGIHADDLSGLRVRI